MTTWRDALLMLRFPLGILLIITGIAWALARVNTRIDDLERRLRRLEGEPQGESREEGS